MPQRERALSLAAAQAGLDLAKNRVDLHRWRQRTALLKVRLSSAHEDVDRYRRAGELLRRQYELEVAAKAGAQGRSAALAAQVAALTARMQQQGAQIAALQADLLRAQEGVAARDAELAAQQAAMVAASDAAQVALAEAQAGAGRLQEQLAAVQERARLAEQTAAASQVRVQCWCVRLGECQDCTSEHAPAAHAQPAPRTVHRLWLAPPARPLRLPPPAGARQPGGADAAAKGSGDG